MKIFIVFFGCNRKPSYICIAKNDRFFERLEAFADSSRSLAAVYVFKRASVAHGNKSGPVEGLVREARPDGKEYRIGACEGRSCHACFSWRVLCALRIL